MCGPRGKTFLGPVALKAGQRCGRRTWRWRRLLVATVDGRGAFAFAVSPGDDLASPGTSRQTAQLFVQPLHVMATLKGRLGCEVAIRYLRDERAALARRCGKWPATPICDEQWRRFDRAEEHVKAQRGKRGSWCCGGWRSSQDVPVAMGNPSGVHHSSSLSRAIRWQARHLCPLVRPTVLALSGRTATDLVSWTVRAAIQLREKIGRRKCPRHIAQGQDGALRRSKFRARRGSACRRWCTPTDWSNSARPSPRFEPGRALDSSAMQTWT